MVLTDPDDIIERLTQRKEFQVNLKDVFSEGDLEEAIKSLEGGSDEIKILGSKGWFTTTKEKAKQELIDNKRDLFNTDAIQDLVIENTSKAIAASKKPSEEVSELAEKTGLSREEVISTVSKDVFESSQRLKGLGTNINRQQILDANLDALKSVRKFADQLGITEDEARDVLTGNDFILFSNDDKFKK